MLTVPFLTDLDSRAAIKGSRDPLGIQPIWTRFGRQVVGNLTTVSNSVRDFTSLLLGYYFVERLADEDGVASDVDTFLKWEQIAAYARAGINDDWGMRGTERVKKNLSEDSRVTISANASNQILGNQKIYGLWGLYTMPARASALIAGEPSRLTPHALELVESVYLPKLKKGAGREAKAICAILKEESRVIDLRGRDAAWMKSVAEVLKTNLSETEREFYREQVFFGGPNDPTDGRQKQLAAFVEATLTESDFKWSPLAVGALVKEATASGEGHHALGDRLNRIHIAECVLAPASVLFSHLLGTDGRTTDFVINRLKDAWGDGLRSIDNVGFRDLRGEISAGVPEVGERWAETANALAFGDYGKVLELLIAQNADVMKQRSGAPWIEMRRGKLHVRFRDEQGSLPGADDLPTLWRFNYFLESLRDIAWWLRT